MVPSPSGNFANAVLANFEIGSIVEAVPYVTFLYLFQPNVPQTYDELKADDDETEEETIADDSRPLINQTPPSLVAGPDVALD